MSSVRQHPARLRNLYSLWRSYIAIDPPAQLDRWIAAELKKHKEFGKADRRYYSDMLFSAARWGLFAAAALRTGSDELNANLVSHAEALASSRDLLSALRSAEPAALFGILSARQGRGIQSYDSLSLKEVLLWNGISPLFEKDLLRRSELSGWSRTDLNLFLLRHETRPPLWIRSNRKDSVSEIIAECIRNGFLCEEAGPCIALTGEKGIYELESRKNGLFEIQDYASAMIGEACDIHPGMFVWDACAGGGGKTMQIAARLEGRGAVVASDLRAYKLDETKERARRAGFSNVRTIPWNGKELPSFSKEIASRGGFHRVLVDAPCSASGTWRRNPDGKLRIDEAAVSDLSALQFEILSAASGSVRGGGLLIYATCSFLPAENEDVASRFLETHSGFELVSSGVHGNPSVDADTTFTAVFRKTEMQK